MEDEWAPMLSKDCMLYTPNTGNAGYSFEEEFHLINRDYTSDGKVVKQEPSEETSDYHGSSSGSPSSSLSTPDMKDNLGVDLSFCMPFNSSSHPFLHSPTDSTGQRRQAHLRLVQCIATESAALVALVAGSREEEDFYCSPCDTMLSSGLESTLSSSGSAVFCPSAKGEADMRRSAFGQVLASGNLTQQHSPLPPVSHFSHQMVSNERIGHEQDQLHSAIQHEPNLFNSMCPQETLTFFEALDERTPSPPTSERSSPSNAMLLGSMLCNPSDGSHYSDNAGVPPVVGSLSAVQQQLKSRSKMHEMAVRQRLITDQDPRSQGLVQLSPEERRTLIQEGYPVPTRLPLTKAEEESLKIVRRKIKNKLSAQESRRKRKEYIDTLETRCHAYNNENMQLKNRLRQLEITNQKLMIQVKKLMEGSGISHPNTGSTD